MKKIWILVVLLTIGALFAVAPLVSSTTSNKETIDITLEIDKEEKQITVKKNLIDQLKQEIIQKTELSLDQINENLKIEIKDGKENKEDEDRDKDEEEREIEIEVEKEGERIIAEIEVNDSEETIQITNTDKKAIIEKINHKTQLTLEEVSDNIEFELEDRSIGGEEMEDDLDE
ncbi:MAG: hypothetical protein BTN85_1192 [Candidatus Methanohalarchaeum thermophilum]|uniref:Uncharacterized protein n=1 Tax=Methanohalarchaeum thermophilum TaxID=1903181 RepID=A0A1Q6DWE7_METT1|nr:MAG: hypothetical protein BTN85_1192 [Candidatus Methanohalarchaeum thermophilum]